MRVIFRAPPTHQAAGPIYGQVARPLSRGALADADADRQRRRLVRSYGRDQPGEMGTERKGKTAGFPNLAIDIDWPGRIIDAEVGDLSARFQDMGTDIIARGPQLVVMPDAKAARAARGADIVEVQPLAMIAMLVAAA